MKKCDPRQVSVCARTSAEDAHPNAQCPTWETCLPWRGKLHYDGKCVKYTPGSPPADGVYGKIVVENGCIVGAEVDDVPQYAAAACAPTPADCNGGGGTGGASIEPSPTTGNLYTLDASGRPLARCVIQAGDNTTVTGNGTTANPYTISSSFEASGVSLQSGNSALTVSGTGASDNPFKVTHKEGAQVTANGMQFDRFGHLTAYNAPDAKGVQGIVPGDGIDASVDNKSGIATISLSKPVHELIGTHTLGGYEVTLDNMNRVFNIERGISISAGTYALAGYDVTLNEYGSVTALTHRGAPGNEIFVQFGKLSNPSSIIRRVCNFTTRYTSALVIVVEAPGTIAGARQFTAYLDDEEIKSMRMECATEFTVPEISLGAGGTVSGITQKETIGGIRVTFSPSGLYAAGPHSFILHSDVGFVPYGDMTVSVRMVQNMDSVEQLTASDLGMA